MLVRAARRKVQHDASRHLQPAFEQLRLPWLCPAQLRYENQKRHKSTATLVSSPTTKGPSVGRYEDFRRSLSRRCLASAAGAERGTGLDDYVPFDQDRLRPRLAPNHEAPWLQERSRSDLREQGPLIINNSLATAPKRFRSHKGMSGDLEELHLTLDACLRVGNLQRAAALLQRLMKIYTPDSPELLEAHNAYIRGNVERIIRYKDQDMLRALQKWFELDIRLRGVEPDATTYALLLKASLQVSSQGPKMERTVRRYMEFALQAQLRDEALSLPILSEAELGMISQICPLDFNKPYEESNVELFASPTSQENQLPSKSKIDEAAELGFVPEVKSMEQKGLGLGTLKKSLSSFYKPSNSPDPDRKDLTPEEVEIVKSYLLQERLEDDAVVSAMERWRSESQQLAKLGLNSILQTTPINALLWEWHTALVPILRQELEEVKQAETKEKKSDADSERCLYGPFLRFLPVDHLAAVTIISVMNEICALGADSGVKLAQVVLRVGGAIQDESFAEFLRRGIDSAWAFQPSTNRQPMLKKLIKRHQFPNQRYNQFAKAALRVEQPENRIWTGPLKAKVGAVLISCLIKAAKVDVSRKHPETGERTKQRQPVFYHSYQYQIGRRLGVIRLNPEIVKKLTKEPVSGLVAKHLPMVVKPKPWSRIDNGGFLRTRVEAIRMKHGDVQQKQYARAAVEKGDMDQVFSGLDVLAKTPWKINRAVFDVMLDAWNSGEAVANLAAENPQISYPEEPPASDDSNARKLWMKQMKMAENQKTGLHSQRCFQNFQLEIARAFLNHTFYYPHNVDFRGRAYPIPPYFNHMGADNSRGLLMFATGKELGSIGLNWLKVHLSNVFGFDKASFQERHDFTMEHLTDVYDSAIRPLNGKRWWLQAEDPWQCLAACIELRNALDSPEPTRYVSHLAVHQDGTCNGLQHYAALGGDSLGARQVNLEPGDRPSDIYTAVAEMIKAEVSEEAAQGNEVAKVLKGNISRKVVKATVMTNVYGVTYTGARRQVRKQLEEIMPDLPYTAGVNHGVTSAYVALKIFKSLSTMFNGAHDIQYWLGECANRISQALTAEQLEHLDHLADGGMRSPRKYLMKGKSDKKLDFLAFKSSVIWTTPLKMPVVQPYRKTSTQEVTTNLQRVSILQPVVSDPVDKTKQLQAFPPNFIHSLDATHMLLSALKCDEVGLTFAAVHDSFWTHASDVDTMNRILRDAFIRMHSEDIIGRLAAEFEARYKGYMYLATVRRHSAVGKKITEYRKANSYNTLRMTRKGANVLDSKMVELLLERKRLRLLASDDPAEQEEGKKMVTPASLFAETADEKDLELPEELKGAGIGDMPTRKTKLQANEQLEVGDVSNADTVDAEVDLEIDPDVEATATPVDEEPEPADEEQVTPKRKKRAAKEKKTHVWLPLTFPPVPKKGDFDVSRLKDSQYFFS